MNYTLLLVYGAPLAMIWGWYVGRRQRAERRHVAVREQAVAAGLVEQPVALLLGRARGSGTRVWRRLRREAALEVLEEEAALPARRAPAGDPALGRPATQRAGADPEQVGGLLHAYAVRSYGIGAHR